MDDDEICERPQRFIRPETDLSEGNAYLNATEDLRPVAAGHPDDAVFYGSDGRPFIWP